jgi:exodeoxyribonuclease V beta subunit
VVLREIPLDRPTVIEASAGTGKTYTLEHLVVEILLTTGTPIQRILVVTFTEKATRDLRARLRSKLEELTSPDRGTDASTAVGDSDFRVDDEGRRRLTDALRSLDVTTIATIHSFCQRVLQENAFTSGRLFDERHVDGRETFGLAFRDTLRRCLAKNEQNGRWARGAVQAGWSAERIERLLWECSRVHAELRPTLDEAALGAALTSFPRDEATDPRIVARLRAAKVPWNTAQAVAKHLSLLADLVDRYRRSGDLPRYVLESAEPLDRLRRRSDHAERVCASAMLLARSTPPFEAALAQSLLPAITRALELRKSNECLYDFDDMLERVDEALRGPRGSAMARQLRERWSYVAIDEFQDTDETQWSIFRRAFFEPSPPPSTVFLIGDPKQAIYRFRGADVQTYVRARSTIVARGVPLVRLAQNFRATPQLVEAQNVLFDPQAPEPMFTGDMCYAPVTAGRPRRSLVDGEGIAVSPVHVLRYPATAKGSISLEEHGDRIAREICWIVDDRKPWRLDGRPVGVADVMVLTRTQEEARDIGDALRRGGVAYAFFKEGGLYQSDQAKDVLDLLRAIDDPDNVSRRLAVWLGPFFDVPLRDLEPARDVPASDPLRARLRTWRALADRGDFERLFPAVVEQSGVARRLLFFAFGEREITNILHLFELLLERARAMGDSLRELVLFLGGLMDETRATPDVDAGVQRLESERCAVQVMTVHKSKGLEAPIVFLAGGWQNGRSSSVHVCHEGDRRVAWVGALPKDVKARVESEDAEDCQRLMYVALTRAMGRLYLPYAAVGDAWREHGQPPDRGVAKTAGDYSVVQRRLTDVLGSLAPGFTVEDVSPAPARPSAPARVSSGPWEPPARWLAPTGDDRPYCRLRERGAAAVITSYTRLHREKLLQDRWATEEMAIHRADRELGSLDGTDVRGESILRSARISGIFLHELLERVPLVSFGAIDIASWRALPDVAALVEEAIAIYGIAGEQREHAELLVWSALTGPVDLPDGGHIDGFARAERVVREMAFVMAQPGPQDCVRAYVRGSIDLAFEHRGRTYFVDWKSDSLSAYDRVTLEEHVHAHYAEQVEIYTLAVAELLGATDKRLYDARFGGILYCFLRGLQAQGIWSARPSWGDVIAWRAKLAARWPGERAP